MQFDKRDVECPPPQIIDQHAQVFVIAKTITIRQGGGGGLVDNAFDRQSGNGASLDGCLALVIVEIRRDGNDRALYWLSQSLFCGTLDVAQNKSRNLLRG